MQREVLSGEAGDCGHCFSRWANPGSWKAAFPFILLSGYLGGGRMDDLVIREERGPRESLLVRGGVPPREAGI